ncbi:MAG: carboxypeptidase regulatory-like domain-containing protein, partial [Candidatus Desantisbacteria bacterium]
RVSVNWCITVAPELASCQKLSATETLTGADGLSSVYLTLGDRQGTYTTEASSSGLTGSPVTFLATATVCYGSLTGEIKPVVYGTKTGVSHQYLSLPGILVELMDVGTTLTSADGGFIFQNILPGTYTLSADTYGASPGTKTNIPILPGKTTDLNLLTLLAGDASNDCEVSMADFNLLAQAFLTSQGDAKWNQEADFNHSNRVDGNDFNILYKNYGLSHLGGGMGEIGGLEVKGKKAYKSATAMVRIYPETLSLKVGDTATLSCDIENVVDYFGADYWFSFDPNVLEITNVTWGGFPVDGWSVSDINNTNGTFFFNAAISLGNPTVSGSGSLAIIQVRGKGVGTTS